MLYKDVIIPMLSTVSRPAVVVFGATGFIGRHLLAYLRREHQAVLGTARKVIGDLLFQDIADPDIRSLRLRERGITHAIICAGITGIAACELAPQSTRAVNVDGTVELARQLNSEGIRVVAFSSDYVFDGMSGDYNEASPVNPLNEYGRQKAELEERLLEAYCGDVLVIRPGKVYDTDCGSGTMLDEMVGKLLQHIPIKAASDQILCPIVVDDLVHVVLKLLTTQEQGIIHVCSHEKISRLGVAQRIVRSFGVDEVLVEGILLHDLGECFNRPLDTSMCCNRLFRLMEHYFSTVDDGIAELKRKYRGV